MKRTSSSARWLREHFSDPYVKRAHQEGYRSRAAFKLLEIQEKDQIIYPGMCVVDLGAAPGGWSILAKKLTGEKGRVIALDILPMPPVFGVEFIQGDFNDEVVLDSFLKYIGDTSVDLVMSDIAPNTTGIGSVDQMRSMRLAEQALFFARQALKPGGVFLVKIFQGGGWEDYLKEMKAVFSSVKVRKPKSSRQRSHEVYVLARGFKGKTVDVPMNPN